VRRRVLFVARTRYVLPLPPGLERKWQALASVMDVRVLASGRTRRTANDARFSLVRPARPAALDGALFWLRLPFRVAREIRQFRPDAIVAQSPFEGLAALAGRRLARRHPAIVVELHGDWRSFSRLYGVPARAALGGLLDRLAPVALRRADAVRTVSDFTSGLARAEGVEPAAEFHTFTDLESFTSPAVEPLPEAPRVLFVGVLERYKAVEILADAWRLAAPRVPSATLHLVGKGSMRDVVERLVADRPGQTVWDEELGVPEVVKALDAATALVLPSRSEGLPRVLIEAFSRGRGVVASRVGGIPDIVTHGETGLIVEPDDAGALADALVRLLSDPALAERLGGAAHAAVEPWLATPEEFAERVRNVVEVAVK
jgi:glycosyltransferase involved in cell wall biosynthesis